MKIALLPGSFDPISNGHKNIIEKGLKLFDKIIIAIAKNDSKSNFLSIEKRLDLLQKCFANNSRIEIKTYHGLTVDYCAEKKIKHIIRGLRDCSDFEYEKKLALMNEDLNQKITTIFIPCSKEFLGVSSSLIKSIIKNNGNYIKFIPKEIKDEKLI